MTDELGADGIGGLPEIGFEVAPAARGSVTSARGLFNSGFQLAGSHQFVVRDLQ